jgi:transcriptional regulator with XRE-family HTH domain
VTKGARLGERLRQVREAADLTQKDVALALGITQQTVSNWEDKESIPAAKYYERLADVLQVDMLEFLHWITDAHRERGEKVRRENVDLRRDLARATELLVDAARRFDQGTADIKRFSDTYQAFHASYERIERQLDELTGQMAQLMRSLLQGPRHPPAKA